MKWQGRRESSNVEDRRAISGRKIAVGGGVIGIIIVLINLFLGGDSSQLIEGIEEQIQQQTEITTEPLSPEEEKMGKFVSVILADTENVWSAIFRQNGLTYREPKLVLFRNSVETACGGASAADRKSVV